MATFPNTQDRTTRVKMRMGFARKNKPAYDRMVGGEPRNFWLYRYDIQSQSAQVQQFIHASAA